MKEERERDDHHYKGRKNIFPNSVEVHDKSCQQIKSTRKLPQTCTLKADIVTISHED